MRLSEFNTVVKSTRMGERARDAARLILVDGISAAEAGRQVGITRQAATKAAQRVEAVIRSQRGIPDHWECVTVCVPPERAAEIREIEREAMRAAGLTVD